MMVKHSLTLLALIALVLATSPVDALEIKPPANKNGSNNGPTTATPQTDRKTPRPSLDEDLERGVLQMVQQHLPDIKVLLDQLREKEPRQYEMAIRNLAKSSRRLQAAEKRGEQSFELEVQIIKAQSAINLLIAKLKVRDNDKDRQSLREATKRFEHAELARARYELGLIESRLGKMQEQFDAAKERLQVKQSQLQPNIDKAFQTYLRKSGRKPLPPPGDD
ncbi:hypothetical protein NHH03_21030 [Stieleria sp. TO1_6]|uniref:hypothetical protein n=1 Tax=Stieleria tagensis TaxID=2956795 RepID=UPI00209AB4DE|nr:hypothetical protein [Stieleria tagensis]MCO8124240.1 hypothetical protein [Stieleria tagensis]